MNISNFRFTECAYIYKLRDGRRLTKTDIHNMMVDVTSGKSRNYAYDVERENGGNQTLFSFRVFKQKNDKPTFFDHPEPGWEEIKVGYYLFVECDEYVAISKKYASIPQFISEKLENIDYADLIGLETQQNFVFKKLSMQNLDGSDYAMRSKTYESLDLSNNIPTVGINRYYVRSVAGDNDGLRFSLMLSSSKINEFRAGLTVSDLCGWVRQKVDAIKVHGNVPDTILSAFATHEEYSSSYSTLEPSSLLIFYSLVESINDDLNTEFYHRNKNGQRRLMDKQVVERYINQYAKAYSQVQIVNKRDGNHYYVGKNNTIEIRVLKTGIRLFNKTWRNIEIEGSPNGEFDGNLLSLINDNHQFNVYFTQKDIVYSNRTLFKDSRLLTSVKHFVKVLQGLPELNDLLFEKYSGHTPNGLTQWDVSSIFMMVETFFMPNYDFFICDDCGDEWADHIGIASDKVSFFISKHKGSENSASDFQDVVGQALKNLGNMSPTKSQLTKKVAKWNGNYQNSNMPCFRSNKGTVYKAIDMWVNNLMNPNFTREMCLVVDFMEAQTFENQLANVAKGIHVPKEESLYQRLWILSSFVNGCLEVGVKPVIYCKP